jgi:hypothetical protein
MPVNANKPERWKADIAQSVDFYNDWFMRFAPAAYRATRVTTTAQVIFALDKTHQLTQIQPAVLHQNPTVLPILRMATAPPIARDRLIGLAGVSANLVKSMELRQRLPPQMDEARLNDDLERIGKTILKLVDKDIFFWLDTGAQPSEIDVHRAATIVADRLCGAVADPIIRNAQEHRQLKTIQNWLEQRGYIRTLGAQISFDQMKPGTFSFRLNVRIYQELGNRQVNLPIDAVVMPLNAEPGQLPLLIEAKSAGDFTNTNKRRNEEATKIIQLRKTYGHSLRFILFLCGYFDSGYLGYEAAEGIDWVWEHHLDDLGEFGL